MRKGNSRLTKDQKNEIRALAKLPDDRIDTTEVPEVLDWSEAKRGLFYRPVNQQTTSRPDSENVCNQKRGRNMSLQKILEELSRNAIEYQDESLAEEPTKFALIIPFIQKALGYDTSKPAEVVPEFTADYGEKKAEKVDFAIMHDRKPVILIECKKVKDPLDAVREKQLGRYFHDTEARFGILTNGITYKFYTDHDSPNKMDVKPFLTIDLANLSLGDVDALEKLHLDKASFDAEKGYSAAEELKYVGAVKTYFREMYTQPDNEFVKFLAGRVVDKHRSPKFIASFTDLVNQSFHEFVSDESRKEVKKTLERASAISATQENSEASVTYAKELNGQVTHVEQVTEGRNRGPTDLEIEGYEKVRAIAAKAVDRSRIAIRTARNFCSVLFDDNSHKRICRLYVKDATAMKLELSDEDKNETEYSLGSLDDISKYADQLQAAVERYLRK